MLAQQLLDDSERTCSSDAATNAQTTGGARSGVGAPGQDVHAEANQRALDKKEAQAACLALTEEVTKEEAENSREKTAGANKKKKKKEKKGIRS